MDNRKKYNEDKMMEIDKMSDKSFEFWTGAMAYVPFLIIGIFLFAFVVHPLTTIPILIIAIMVIFSKNKQIDDWREWNTTVRTYTYEEAKNKYYYMHNFDELIDKMRFEIEYYESLLQSEDATNDIYLNNHKTTYEYCKKIVRCYDNDSFTAEICEYKKAFDTFAPIIRRDYDHQHKMMIEREKLEKMVLREKKRRKKYGI